MKKILTIAFVAFAINTLAQTKFVDGFIITNNLDTVHGLISNNVHSANNKYCEFKTDTEAAITRYLPNEIHSYRFNNGKYYISKKFTHRNKNHELFLEYLIKGKVNVFAAKEKGEDIYFLQKGIDSLIHLENDLIYYNYNPITKKWEVSEEETLQKVSPSKKYIGILSYYLSDASGLQQKINNTNLSHKPLIRIAKDYHYAICDNEECIVYEKNTDSWIAIGIYASYSKLMYPNLLSSTYAKPSFELNRINTPGLFALFQAKGLNNNIQFRIALQFNKLEAKMKEVNYRLTSNEINIPFSIQYTHPTKFIQPYINGGLLINYHFNTDFYDQLGYNLRISEDYMYKSLNTAIHLSTGLLYKADKFIFDTGIEYNYFISDNKTRKKSTINVGAAYVF